MNEYSEQFDNHDDAPHRRHDDGAAHGASTSHGSAPRRRIRRVPLATTAAATLAAVGVLHFHAPQRPLLEPPFRLEAGEVVATLPFARAAAEAFGRSGGVKMQFVLPRTAVDLPLEVDGDRAQFAYQWVRAVDSVATGAVRPLASAARLVAPDEPGFYHLALVRSDDGDSRLVEDVTVTVLVPFSEKQGPNVRGFKLGNYVGEKQRRAGLPQGFVPVEKMALNLPVSKSLRLRDVLTTPDVPRLGFPEYAALDGRLLEKLELVVQEVRTIAGLSASAPDPRLSINSGFRPPSYNATVSGAAGNSRHQYGDAADVQIDINRDGKFTMDEVRLVVKAIEAVERKHPDLLGGIGLYTSKKFRSPYVHIDARGNRARWTG